MTPTTPRARAALGVVALVAIGALVLAVMRRHSETEPSEPPTASETMSRCDLERFPILTERLSGTVSAQALGSILSVRVGPDVDGETLGPWFTVSLERRSADAHDDLPGSPRVVDVDRRSVSAVYNVRENIGPVGDEQHTIRDLTWRDGKIGVMVAALDVDEPTFLALTAGVRFVDHDEWTSFLADHGVDPVCPEQ